MSANTAKKVSYFFMGLSFLAIIATLAQLIGNAYGILFLGSSDMRGRYVSMYLAYVPFLLLVGVVVALAKTIVQRNVSAERIAFYLFIALLLHKAIVLYVSSNVIAFMEISGGQWYYSDLVMVTTRRLNMTDILTFRMDILDIRSYLYSVSSLEFLPIISIAIGKSLLQKNKNGLLITTGVSLCLSFFLFGIFALLIGYSMGMLYFSPLILELALFSYAFYFTFVKDKKSEEEMKVKGEAYE